jgi:hypothetical protein
MTWRLALAVLLVAHVVATGAARPQSPLPAPAPALTHWCTMHPDERAASAILCPICRMPMVPIPPMRVGEYRMQVTPMADRRGRGLTGLQLRFRDPARGAVVPALETVHERPLHLFVVGRDLEFFRHLHPEARADGVWEVRSEMPSGELMVIADFLPTGGLPQLLQRVIVSPGARREAVRGRALPEPIRSIVVDSVRVQLDSISLEAGRASTVKFLLSMAGAGQPVVDLEPYLGVRGHLLLVSEDLTHAVHGHAPLSEGAGPVLAFDVTLPRAGRYRAWLEFQRHGKVVTVPMALIGRQP